jgi:hypothetical protein
MRPWESMPATPERGGWRGGEGQGRGSGVIRACARQPIASGQNGGSCTGHPDRFSRHPTDFCATKHHQMSPAEAYLPRAPTAPARADRARRSPSRCAAFASPRSSGTSGRSV